MTRIFSLLWLLTILAGLPILGAGASGLWHIFDLLGQFALQGAGLGALALIAAAAARQRAIAAVAALVFALGLITIWPRTPLEACGSGTPTLRVVFHNIWVRNNDPAGTAEALAALDADILVLAEVMPWLAPHFDRFQATHPYRSECIETQSCRMLILSKHPFEDLTAAQRAPGAPPALAIIRLRLKGNDLSLIGTHLTRPWPFDRPAAQIRQADGLLASLRDVEGAKLILGDLNAVTWGHVARRISERSDTAILPSAATWHAGHPMPIRMPIDHILAGGIPCATKSVLPRTGSDHRPISIEFSL